MISDHFYSIPVGAGIGGNVTVATSTTGGSVFELRVTDATAGMTKMEVLRLLEVLADYVVTDSAPA